MNNFDSPFGTGAWQQILKAHLRIKFNLPKYLIHLVCQQHYFHCNLFISSLVLAENAELKNTTKFLIIKKKRLDLQELASHTNIKEEKRSSEVIYKEFRNSFCIYFYLYELKCT